MAKGVIDFGRVYVSCRLAKEGKVFGREKAFVFWPIEVTDFWPIEGILSIGQRGYRFWPSVCFLSIG